MNYRRLGKTGLMVSEIGFGGEWLDRNSVEEGVSLLRYANRQGINIIDCWMPDPKCRDIIGLGMEGHRSEWYVQGQFGSTWKDNQYYRTRDMAYVKPAFEDLLRRLKTDYIDIGVIHFVDSMAEWNEILQSDYLRYILDLKQQGVVHHIGMSTHNPRVARAAVESGLAEMILFSINPAYDMLPPTEDFNIMFSEEYDPALGGINKERADLYRLCEEKDIGLTVMKGFAGGRLLDANTSPFKAALTPLQCIHYALTRPAVASILCGYLNPAQVDAAVAYETADDSQKDYAAVLATAPRHACKGQCTYCGHCKPCVAQLDIAMINKYYDLAVQHPQVPATVQGHYLALEHHASECVGCRQCEERCPFGVAIAAQMEKAAALFGV